MPQTQALLSGERLAAFCAKWQIAELSMFGSVLRDDFRNDSDVDFLVAFKPGESWSLWDLAVMQDELSALLGGRDVDIVEKQTVVNPFLRREILSTRRVIYAA